MNLIPYGSTDKSVYMVAVDSTTGEAVTDLAYNSSGLAIWYRREGAATTSITPASLGSVSTAHTDGGFIHVGNGIYRIDSPDAAFSSGVSGVMFSATADGAYFYPVYVQLVGFNPADGVRLGLTALPNAAVNATGGLMTAKRGGTAQAGASSTITLDAGASSSDDFYVGDVVQIVGGTGAGQSRIITDYVGSTKVATVDTAWTTNPSSDSVFVLIPQGIVGVTDTDVADAVLGATASSYDDAGTIGEKINDAASAGDPWSTALPGSYTSGQAGKIVGDALDAAVSSRASQSSVDTVDGIVDAILADTGTDIPNALIAIANYVDSIPADVLDAPNGIETGVTVRQAIRGCIRVLAAKVSGAGTTTITFRDLADTKNSVVATVDEPGNRSAVTLDLT